MTVYGLIHPSTEEREGREGRKQILAGVYFRACVVEC